MLSGWRSNRVHGGPTVCCLNGSHNKGQSKLNLNRLVSFCYLKKNTEISVVYVALQTQPRLSTSSPADLAKCSR